MNDADKEVYLRVYRDMPFMLEAISLCGQQADSFTSEMLFKRIILEREALRLEKDREQREYEARRIQENANQVELKERNTDD